MPKPKVWRVLSYIVGDKNLRLDKRRSTFPKEARVSQVEPGGMGGDGSGDNDVTITAFKKLPSRNAEASDATDTTGQLVPLTVQMSTRGTREPNSIRVEKIHKPVHTTVALSGEVFKTTGSEPSSMIAQFDEPSSMIAQFDEPSSMIAQFDLNKIECQCCTLEEELENLVQCAEGHIFCAGCLQLYIQESVYGQGRPEAECMVPGCVTIFTRDQLEKALPADLLKTYDQRLMEESLNIADLEGLVRCHACAFAAILPDDLEVLECLDPYCGKKTCRHCNKSWEGHEDNACQGLDDSETSFRTHYEESLTSVVIRMCPTCKSSFVKQFGCNRMICRCGAKMCYLCRKMKVEYDHFCQHVQDPLAPGECKKCSKCLIWTDPTQDEIKASEELKATARRERIVRGFSKEKPIGT